MQQSMLKVIGVDIELHEGGAGTPLLFLHRHQAFAPGDPYVDLLAASYRLLAPSHPGSGRSELPDWLDTPRLQQPDPPIWVSTTSASGAERVGARGYVQATFLTGYEGTRRIYDAARSVEHYKLEALSGGCACP